MQQKKVKYVKWWKKWCIRDYLKLDFKHGTLKNGLAALEEINKIERLKEQVKNSDYLILNSENEAIEYEKKHIASYCSIRIKIRNITYTN